MCRDTESHYNNVMHYKGRHTQTDGTDFKIMTAEAGGNKSYAARMMHF